MPSSDPNILLQRATQSIELAKSLGAQHAFAHASRSRSVQCELRDKKLEKLQESGSRSLSIQLFVDGRYSSHSTTDLREASLKSFVKDAVELTRMLQPDPHRALPDPQFFATPGPSGLQISDATQANRRPEDRIRFCEAANAPALGKADVISVSTQCWDRRGETAAAGSNGFSGQYEGTVFGGWTSVTLKDTGDKRPQDGWGMSVRQLSDLKTANEIGSNALTRARVRLGASKGPSMEAAMVVDHRAAGSIIGRLLGPTSGSSVQQGRSFWAGKIEAGGHQSQVCFDQRSLNCSRDGFAAIRW